MTKKKINRVRQQQACAQQRRRDKMKDAGFVGKRVWVHESQMEKFEAFTKTLISDPDQLPKQKPAPLPE